MNNEKFKVLSSEFKVRTVDLEKNDEANGSSTSWYDISDTKRGERIKAADEETLGLEERENDARRSTPSKRIDKVIVTDRIVLISARVADRIGHGSDFHTIRARRSDHCHQDDQSILRDLSFQGLCLFCTWTADRYRVYSRSR